MSSFGSQNATSLAQQHQLQPGQHQQPPTWETSSSAKGTVREESSRAPLKSSSQASATSSASAQTDTMQSSNQNDVRSPKRLKMDVGGDVSAAQEHVAGPGRNFSTPASNLTTHLNGQHANGVTTTLQQNEIMDQGPQQSAQARSKQETGTLDASLFASGQSPSVTSPSSDSNDSSSPLMSRYNKEGLQNISNDANQDQAKSSTSHIQMGVPRPQDLALTSSSDVRKVQAKGLGDDAQPSPIKPRKNAVASRTASTNVAESAVAAEIAAANATAAAATQMVVESMRPANSRAFSSTTAAPASSTAAAASSQNKDDVDQLQDLLGMSGVDLKAEEEAIHGRSALEQGSSTATPALAVDRPADAIESPFFLNVYSLSRRITSIASRNGLRVDPEVLLCISTASRLRFRNLLEAMVSSSRHRQWSSHLRPPPLYEGSSRAMYHEEVYDDPHKLLSALTRVEKAEEQAARQRRLERDEKEANRIAGIVEESGQGGKDETVTGAEAGAETSASTPTQPASGRPSGGGGEAAAQDAAKSKAKKPGIAAAARNMSEDKRLKLANKTAAQALGFGSSGSKAWMFGGGTTPGGSGSNTPLQQAGGAGGSRLPKPRFNAVPKTEAGPGVEGGAGAGSGEGAAEDKDSSQAISNPGRWGDLAARQRHREEEERRRTRQVNLEDALHALEMESSGGAGRGSGERVLFVTRALGRPTLPMPPP